MKESAPAGEIQRVQDHHVRQLRIGQDQAGRVMLHDAPQAPRDGVEQVVQFQVGDHAVVDLQHQTQAIAFARELVLQVATLFVVHRIVQRHRHLSGHQLAKFQFFVAVSAFAGAPEGDGAHAPLRRGQGQTAKRRHAVMCEQFEHCGIPAQLLQRLEVEQLLRGPYLARRRRLYRKLPAVRVDLLAPGMQHVQAHGAGFAVVERDHEKVEAQKLLQTLGQLVEKHRHVAMRGDDAGDFH